MRPPVQRTGTLARLREKLRRDPILLWSIVVVLIVIFGVLAGSLIIRPHHRATGSEDGSNGETFPTTSQTPKPGGGGGGGQDSSGSTTTATQQQTTTTTTSSTTTTTTTTTDPDNQPPNAPSSPTPADGSDDWNPDSVTLSWTGGDPDAEDSVEYLVEYGTTNPPAGEACAWQSATSCTVTSLQPDTTYYWKVTAKDEHGAETEGPVWSFKTKLGGEEPPGPDVCPEPLICPPGMGPS